MGVTALHPANRHAGIYSELSEHPSHPVRMASHWPTRTIVINLMRGPSFQSRTGGFLLTTSLKRPILVT